MVKRFLCCLVVMVAWSLPTAAHAQDEDRAKELFFEGHAAADRGEYDVACAHFRESLEYFRRVSTLLNLGKCSDEIGEIAEALRYWSESAALLEPGDPRMVIAKKRIGELETRVPRLRLTLPQPLPDGAVVELDGAVLTREQHTSPLRFNPGAPHRLDLVVPGHDTRSVSVTLAEGEEREIALEVGAARTAELSSPPAGASPTVQDSGLSGIQIGGIVVGAVGVAGLVVGGVTGALVLDHKATVDAYCKDDLCTDPEGVTAAESGRTLATVSTVAFIGGGVAVATAVLMVVLGSDDDSTELTALLGPGGGGLMVVGRW